ncbi:hypothetical protein D3C81_1435740 [compost metagenome]
MGDSGTGTFLRYDRASRSGNRILGRGRFLRTVFGRIAKLFLHRTVMAGRTGHDVTRPSGIGQESGESQTLHRGGAGAKHAEIRSGNRTGSKRRGDDLIHQIPTDEEGQILPIDTGMD